LSHLILNIDLEYIRAVISTEEGDYRHVKTEDRESVNCFWLYFKIDQFNRLIKCRKIYQQKVLDKSPGYIGYSYPKERDLESEKVLFDNQNYNLSELLDKAGTVFSKTGI